MADKKFIPYVPAETTMPELTFKALFLGVVMAVVLGAANAYLGMKVGLTVAATFPAAVVAMAALRIFRGNILEGPCPPRYWHLWAWPTTPWRKPSGALIIFARRN